MILLVCAAGLSVAESAQAGSTESSPDYDQLQRKIVVGEASFQEVRIALGDKDPSRLVNTLHMMHTMRWQRSSIRLLIALWDQRNKEPYPEVSWELFSKPPVRLALASILLRLSAPEKEEYLGYLLEHKYDEHEFHRAQVVIALGLHGNPKDVEYLSEMADSDTRYVVQSSITALGLMQDPKAQLALGKLWKKHRGTPRGDLIEEVLERVYRVTPHVKGEPAPTQVKGEPAPPHPINP